MLQSMAGAVWAMKSSVALTISLALQGLLHGSLAHKQPRCRCLSTEPCWPSADAFATLASQVSQPLLSPNPPAAACYPATAPSGDCATVQQSWMNGTWHADQPGSMQSPNFDDFIFSTGKISACYLDASLGFPCQQGSVPVLGVDARTPKDIQVAVKFAALHNLRVVVKNTGYVCTMPRLIRPLT